MDFESKSDYVQLDDDNQLSSKFLVSKQKQLNILN